MTIKQHGGIFGRNPTFNEIGGTLTTAAQPNVTSLGTQTSNLAFASGNGIDFSATAGTGTSELFDDYEEGAWTPAYAFATPGTSAFTYTGSRGGKYTKCGNLVTCFFNLDNVTIVKGTASGVLNVTGLPFTVGGSEFFGGVVIVTDSYPVNPQALFAVSGTTTALIRTAGGAGAVTNADFAASNTVFLRGVIQYQV